VVGVTKELRLTEILFFVLAVHTVSVGFGFMGNSPFGIIVCYIHFIFVGIGVVLLLKDKVAWKGLILASGILNVMLIIYGLVEISAYPNIV